MAGSIPATVAEDTSAIQYRTDCVLIVQGFSVKIYQDVVFNGDLLFCQRYTGTQIGYSKE